MVLNTIWRRLLGCWIRHKRGYKSSISNGARHWLPPFYCYIYMDGSLSHRAIPRELAQPIL